MRGKLWSLALYLFVLGFILNLLGIVTHVTVSAFAKRWFGTPLPPSFTTDWFVYAWTNFDLGRVLTVTVIVALCVVVLALLIACPAAYILGRHDLRRDPRQPGADGAARDLRADSILRADQPQSRMGGADARREPRPDLP